MKTYNDNKLSFEISFDEYLDYLEKHPTEYTEEDLNSMRALERQSELHGNTILI